MAHPKNESDNEPNTKNLVKPGSTIDPSKGPGGFSGQGQVGQGQQQGGPPIQRVGLEEDRDKARQRQQDAFDEAERRERDNNPATREMRQSYSKDAPGMLPQNQPAEDTKYNKPTRVDLEDITGNPGHRGVNPDAPANSINGPPVDRGGRAESINEPRGWSGDINNNDRTPENLAGTPGGTVFTGSINEPPGSQVIPPGAGQGTGEEVEHPAGSVPPPGGPGSVAEAPTIEALEPDEAEVGSADIVMEVHGTGFTPQSVVQFGPENDLVTTFISETELTAPVKPSEWGDGVIQVRVKAGGDGSLKSEPVEFEFTPAGVPEASRQTKRTQPKKTKKTKR